ncbi:hypothetical protein Hypma_006393 [Hypsizygus marmoreus]|uniref:Protein kinase domain-containing protein n=1 Tax=Hypsizygus marmoreus TaxID=39966 RepID=A0A369JUJ9_HYPMA|nr:hypothetical protein Hypma_006393 [Hypsizygus marmoreus]
MEGWDSIALPMGKPHLELELGKRLGEGRIGFVYVAHVVAVLDGPGGAPISNPTLELSTELVLKFVRPTNCRSLAQESWFYERLPEAEGFQGAVVPLCYGFFTASTTSMQPPLPAPLKIKPWIDKYGEHAPVDFPMAEREFGDELPDDYAFDDYRDDGRTCRPDSPWEDIVDLIDDLSAAAIKHHDFKFNNIVRARTNVVCPRHKYAHRWRVIDFDRSERWAKTLAIDDDYFPQIIRYQFVKRNYKEFPVTFWMSLG